MDINLEKGNDFVIATGDDQIRELRVSYIDTLTDENGVKKNLIYLTCGIELHYRLR